jgi:hypothetical protein
MFETYIVRCDYDDESTAARRKIWWGKVLASWVEEEEIGEGTNEKEVEYKTKLKI